MAVGRPISLTPNIATKTLSSTATADQTSFTVTGGYRINELGVYRNGVRLVQGKDFTASDGSTVTLLSGATVDDIIDFVIFDSFNIADAINTVGNQTISGELTATAFYGDGSTLTGVGDTAYIDAASLTVSGIATFNGVGNFDAEVTAAGGVDITGGLKVGAASTLQVVTATTGTFSGAVNIDDTTASTSTSTGALIVDGGVGIAGSLHVGENVSVGGTLTYEDVTNIDSVGVVTAQLGVIATAGRGVQITAGGLNVTAGIATFKNEVDADGGVDIAGGLKVAGISTFGGGDIQISGNATGITSAIWDASADSLIFKDGSYAAFGDNSDFRIHHDGATSILDGRYHPIEIRHQSEVHIKCTDDGSVELYEDNSKKFETTNDGTVTTGISTASDFVIGAGGTSVHTALGTKASTGKAIAMAMVFG